MPGGARAPREYAAPRRRGACGRGRGTSTIGAPRCVAPREPALRAARPEPVVESKHRCLLFDTPAPGAARARRASRICSRCAPSSPAPRRIWRIYLHGMPDNERSASRPTRTRHRNGPCSRAPEIREPHAPRKDFHLRVSAMWAHREEMGRRSRGGPFPGAENMNGGLSELPRLSCRTLASIRPRPHGLRSSRRFNQVRRQGLRPRWAARPAGLASQLEAGTERQSPLWRPSRPRLAGLRRPKGARVDGAWQGPR